MKKCLFFISIFVPFSMHAGWTNTYGGSFNDWGNSVQQTTDGGYIVAGYTESYGAGRRDVFLIKTSVNGDTSWTRTYGGSKNDYGHSVQQTADGGYIVVGYTESYGAGCRDVFLIKTSANGDTSWTRTYGGTNGDESYSIQQTSDGGYIISGVTWSYGVGDGDVYLVKTDANGVSAEEVTIPNPAEFFFTADYIFKNTVEFRFILPQEQEIEINIYDATGRHISTPVSGRFASGKHEKDVPMDGPGVYFYTIESDGLNNSGKFIVVE